MAVDHVSNAHQAATSYAHKDGVGTLYKFMRYPTLSPDSSELRGRVERLITQGEIYFPLARQLNDPFEASPIFGHADKDVMLAGLENWAQQNGMGAQELAERKAAMIQQFEQGTVKAHIDAVMAKYREEFRTNFPMFCLAATRQSTLMWSYYTDAHSGICLHFDAMATTNSPFGLSQKISYSTRYPEILVPIASMGNDRGATMLTRALLTKSHVWEHEKEYRLLNLPRIDGPNPPRVLDDLFHWKAPQLALMQPRLLRGVTVGASMASHDIERILKLSYDRKPRIPVERARTSDDCFDLVFEPIEG
jgi:hypothetical protein